MHNIKNFKVTFSVVLLVLFLVTGCNKEKDIISTTDSTTITSTKLVGVPNCDAMVKNGYLNFETKKDLDAYNSFLQSSHDDDIDKIEIKNNFMSYERKIAIILKEYEILNEIRSTTMQEILSFRKKYEKYITITDEDFFLKIEGISNRILNSEGYMQIGNRMHKHEQRNIYTTPEANASLLQSGSYSSDLIDKTEVTIVDLNSDEVTSNSEDLSQGNSLDHTWKSKCGRWHSTQFRVSYVSQTYIYGAPPGPLGKPHYAVTTFLARVHHKKRGWTGVWYGHGRYSRHKGYYHAEHEPFRTFDNVSYAAYSDKFHDLRERYFASHWSAQNYLNAVNWYSWGYISGTLTYDLCGTKTFSY